MRLASLTKLLQIVCNGSASLGMRKMAGRQLGALLADSNSMDPILSVLDQVRFVVVYMIYTDSLVVDGAGGGEDVGVTAGSCLRP